MNLPKLSDFKHQLKQVVKGQDEAVDVISTTLYKYLMKAYSRDHGIRFEGGTSLLLLGDSGTGKTYLMKQAAKLSNITMVELNAKSIVQEGWGGGKNFLEQIKQSRLSVHGISGGIIFIDEFDKLASINISSRGEDVNYQIQAGLLKYIEGMDTDFGVDFNDCLFVLAGAFVGLEYNKPQTTKIGFNPDTRVEKEHLNEALSKYGMLDEMIGRVQDKVVLNKITHEVYCELLETPTFCLNSWTNALKKMDITLQPDYASLIAQAEESKLGVRGLIQAVEKLVAETMNKNEAEIDLEKYSPLYTKQIIPKD